MPTMGRPISDQENKFGNVTMARSNSNRKVLTDDKDKERLVNNLTGYKPKNDLFVDGEKHNQMGKDEFLKLLTYQLQNQDPSKPMEQKEMSGQLAQFSQLEQLTNLNSKFDNWNKNQNVEDKFYGASFLGKEVVTNGTSLNLQDDGGEADVLYSLPDPASKVLIRIFDQNNAMIGEMWKENVGRGSQTATWDGVALDGQPSTKGEYRVQVFAWDNNSQPLDVKTHVKGVVESVFFENGEAVLQVDGKKVFLRDVDSFHVPGRGKLGAEQKQIATALQGVASNPARSAAANLPIAQQAGNNLNLMKAQQKAGLDAYGKQPTSTYDENDMSSVYDEE